MTGSTSYYRDRVRSRSVRREPPRTDALTTVLTAQVIICLLLTAVLMTVKKADNAAYVNIRAEYQVMITDWSQNERALEIITQAGGGFSQLADMAERYIGAILSRFNPDKDSASEERLSSEPESAGTESVAPEYDYLKEQNAAPAGGQGGMLAVNIVPVANGLLPAPNGSTFAPVVLNTRMCPPITGTITSMFAYRDHPVSGKTDFHTGIDIAAEEGRIILAALPGEVIEVGESDIYGKYIVLQHATNLRTSYSHCSEIIASEGAAVRQGERIAKVGSTGTVTGPHLHFSVIVEEQFVDPYWVLSDNIELVE